MVHIFRQKSISTKGPYAKPQLRSPVAIRDEVENRLTRLPAETLRIIQHAVDARVEQTEAHYRRLALVSGLADAIVLAGFFGVTWFTVADKVSKIVMDTEVARRTQQVGVYGS